MKGISTDTFRRGKINASLFLAVIIFFFLLFLEYFSDENEAYETLCTDIRELLYRMIELQNDIKRNIVTITEAIDSRIAGKIGDLIELMRSSLNNLEDSVPGKEIKKNINISQQKNEALGYLSPFSPTSTHKFSIMLNKLEKTWQIWEDQIQQKVNEAISSASQ